MNFTHKSPKWDNVGAEPTEEIIKKGFTAGYKPPASYFNWFWNRVCNCIKEIQEKLGTVEEHANNYTHPATHTADIIIQDETHRFLSDSKITELDNKLSSEEKGKPNGVAMLDSNGKIIAEQLEIKNSHELTIQTNGTTQATYDGSAAKTVNITPSNIGAATSNHTHSASQVTGLPSSLPANGGNADTTDGYHFMVATSKPSSLSNNVICFVYE